MFSCGEDTTVDEKNVADPIKNEPSKQNNKSNDPSGWLRQMTNKLAEFGNIERMILTPPQAPKAKKQQPQSLFPSPFDQPRQYQRLSRQRNRDPVLQSLDLLVQRKAKAATPIWTAMLSKTNRNKILPLPPPRPSKTRPTTMDLPPRQLQVNLLQTMTPIPSLF